MAALPADAPLAEALLARVVAVPMVDQASLFRHS
jgi:hypothetical protein